PEPVTFRCGKCRSASPSCRRTSRSSCSVTPAAAAGGSPSSWPPTASSRSTTSTAGSTRGRARSTSASVVIDRGVPDAALQHENRNRIMKPHTIRLLCVSGLLTVLCHPAAAQEGLMEIYQRALQNDPAIREAEARYLANSEVKPQARAQLLPSLSFSTSTTGSFNENPVAPTDPETGENIGGISGYESDSDSFGWQLSVNQTVFDWSQILSLRQADKRVVQAQTEYEAQRQQLLLRVAEAYFNVLAAEDSLEAQRVAREALERQLEQAQRRFDVGLIAITDVQERQAGFDLAVAQEIEAQRVLATEQERLREIIGDYVTELASPGEEIPLVSPDPRNPDEWVQVAMRQNLALISARLAADIAQDDIAIQRAGRLPTLSFQSGYRFNEQTGT